MPKTAQVMAEQGIPEEHIRLVTYANALAVYGQSGQMNESDWLVPATIDQRTLYQGSSLLRVGRHPASIDARKRMGVALRMR